MVTSSALSVVLDVGDVQVVSVWPSQARGAANAELPDHGPWRPAWAARAWQHTNSRAPAAPMEAAGSTHWPGSPALSLASGVLWSQYQVPRGSPRPGVRTLSDPNSVPGHPKQGSFRSPECVPADPVYRSYYRLARRRKNRGGFRVLLALK